ncbi:glycosyltransferase [Pedobacter sp. N23S346]|uniref:glycosyltransferase n=1 Tax=Pedobacter sp. N23S346 TaxID=3402750 RepID=UPI003AF1A244
MSVVIPVKNEAECIQDTLDAIRLQCDSSGNKIDYNIFEVLVLANNCTDQTFQICEAYQITHPEFALHVVQVTLEGKSAHIGTARRLLMDNAYQRLMQVAGDRGIIVSTDGDSQADPTWIYHILAEMENGVDVVGGRILPRDTPLQSKLHHLRDVTYRLFTSRLESVLDPCIANPWPRHFQCYGPSLAVTCEIYDRSGRLPAIPYLEDEEFRKRLKRIDAKIRHSPNVKIYTSSRLTGRVEFGFSIQLKQWQDMSTKGEQQLVESLETLIFKLNVKHSLRKLWATSTACPALNAELKSMAAALVIDFQTLKTTLQDSPYFESFWEQIEDHLLSIDHAEIIMEPISNVIASVRQYFSKSFAQPVPPSLTVAKSTEMQSIAV